MKIQLDDRITANISLVDLANEIHAQGRYLRDNFSKEDLTEPGTDIAGTDCRLRWHAGTWSLLTGSADYDQDHRGYWASSSIERGITWKAARELARELIDGLE